MLGDKVMNRYDITNLDLEKKYIQNSPAEMPGGFLVYRANDVGEILYANEALLKIYDCETSAEFMQLTGGVFDGMIYPEDRQDVKNKIQEQILADEGRFDQVNYRIKTLSGKIVYVTDYGKCVHDELEGDIYYVFVTTSRSRLDGLTGLQSDWYFLEMATKGLETMYKSGIVPVVLSFDFIGMKGFNNKYGREEGDKLLVVFSKIISDKFGNNRCSRFGEDHFYAYGNARDIEKALNEIIVAFHEANNGRNLPVKIGICKYILGISTSTLCDWAKLACESKKNYYSSGFEWFNDDMAKSFDKTEYILSHVDRALIDGSIQVYYQPVVRTMTRELASFEALVRWQDKRYGMISPGEFIPVLEDSGLAYKIDRFVIKHVASVMKDLQDKGIQIVPVSINISQTDFEMMDPVDTIIKTVDEQGIPRGMIVVEITETALVSDNGMIKNAINKLHEAGFEVWMDDFGSGYSSLNVLKDYNFDEIKIDMNFMRNFDEKSKSIVRLAVKMAKELGIHTLAEGVENSEQINFLTEIGCEKVQGYYYGKPMPLEQAFTNIHSLNIDFETRNHASFYDAAGLINLPDDIPTALFYFSNDRFKLLYQNQKYKEVITADTVSGDEAIEWNMNSSQSGLRTKFLNLAYKAIESNEEEKMIFVDRNSYYYFAFEKAVSKKGEAVLQATIHETDVEDVKQIEQLDVVSRNITTMYDAVYLVDLENTTRTVIYSDLLDEETGTVYEGESELYERNNKWHIYFDDIDRFHNEFASRTALLKRINESKRGYFSEQFRIKDVDGNYVWTQFDVLALPETAEMKFLVCVKPAYIEGQNDKMAAINRLVNNMAEQYFTNSESDYSDIWNSIIRESDIKLFWKDMDRRFLGASKSFLDYYGFESEDAILGKTDEDIGWHINDIPFMEVEKNVLNHGKVYKNIRGENVVNGVLHNILASKFPVYKKGRIIGLVGYFIDVEHDIGDYSTLNKVSTMDDATGLMNVQGMIISVLGYDSNFRDNKEDYAYATIKLTEYDSIIRDYGVESAHVALRYLADILSDVFDSSDSVARVGAGTFAIAIRGISQNDIYEKMAECRRRIADIHTLNGRKIRLSINYGVAYGSEQMDVRGVVKASLERLEKSAMDGTDRIGEEKSEFDLYDEIPLPFVVVRCVYDDNNNKPSDLVFIFVNKRFCELSGYSSGELIHKSYSKVFTNMNSKWLGYGYRASRGEILNARAYSMALGELVEFVAAPSQKTGDCVFLFKAVGFQGEAENSNEIELLTYKKAFKSFLKLEKHISFDDVTALALEDIGEMLDADRAFIVETGDDYTNIVHEWAKDELMILDSEAQEKSFIHFEDFIHTRENNGLIKLNDVQDIRETYVSFYNYLRSVGVYNSVMAPLYWSGNIIGYLCLDNYNIAQDFDIDMLIKLFAKYLSMKLGKKIIYEEKGLIKEENSPHANISNNSVAVELTRDIARNFDSNKTYDESVYYALNAIMEKIKADRVYILEIDRGIVNNTFEVCAPGVASEKSSLQNLEYEKYYKPWDNMLNDDDVVVIEDVQMMRKISSEAYVTIIRRGIERLIASPYYYNGKVMGFVCLDNYNNAQYQKCKMVVQAAANVIGARVVTHYFQRVNSYDDLTGVHNRNAMLEREDEIKRNNKSIGIVFADLNGLKRINDESGHDAGDNYIRGTANILIDIYGVDNIYRSGGDEFMVILEDVTQNEFNRLKGILRTRLSEEQAPEVAVGFDWKKSAKDMDEAMSTADKQMYIDKEKFYEKREKYRK